MTKWVMAQSGVDVWRIDLSNTVDMRMSRELYMVVRDSVPSCHLLVDSVEALVQEAEEAMFSQSEAIWEEVVIEEVHDGKAS